MTKQEITDLMLENLTENQDPEAYDNYRNEKDAKVKPSKFLSGDSEDGKDTKESEDAENAEYRKAIENVFAVDEVEL